MAFGTPFSRWVYNNSPSLVRDFMATEYSRRRGLKKFGAPFQEHLANLERIQYYSAPQLYALQDENIRRVLWQAGRFVPFYRRQFKELDFNSQSAEGRTQLECLPILEKSSVQSHPSAFRSALYEGTDRAEIIHSSGTTGKAIQVAVAVDYLKLEKAYLWLQRSWCGVKPGDRTAYFAGFPVVPIRQDRPPFWVRDLAENRVLFSLQHMSHKNLPAYAVQLERFAPQQVVGYPTAIYLMAAFVNAVGIRAIRPSGVFTASETLLPHQRQVIESAFGCPVFDLYGQAELCGMIMQCDGGNYHVQEGYGVIEILKPGGRPALPGETGEMICTGLNNMAMPFIRYRTGDTAIPKAGACPCGRSGALVECIVGRIEDIIVTPDGRFLSRLDFVFKELPEVREAQLVQEARDRVRIRLVTSSAFTPAHAERIAANFRERAGNEIKIEFEMLDQIPRLPNGKFRFVVSKVPLDLPPIQQTGEVLGIATHEEKML